MTTFESAVLALLDAGMFQYLETAVSCKNHANVNTREGALSKQQAVSSLQAKLTFQKESVPWA